MSTIAKLEEAISRADTALALSVIKSLLENNSPVPAPVDPGLSDRIAVLEERVAGLAKMIATGQRDPLDHDGDGRRGGSLPKAQRAAKAAPTTPEA